MATVSDLMKCEKSILISLYERCQKMYYGEHGFYWMLVPTCHLSIDVRKELVAKWIAQLSWRFGWNCGFNQDYSSAIAETHLDFSSVEELELKLAMRGF